MRRIGGWVHKQSRHFLAALLEGLDGKGVLQALYAFL
jgi:hypothetical protein